MAGPVQRFLAGQIQYLAITMIGIVSNAQEPQCQTPVPNSADNSPATDITPNTMGAAQINQKGLLDALMLKHSYVVRAVWADNIGHLAHFVASA